MTSDKMTISITFSPKDTAKWRPLQLANKIKQYIDDGKISSDDIFVSYIEIVPCDDAQNIEIRKPSQDWIPGDMCLLYFTDRANIEHDGETMGRFIERLMQVESDCLENEAIGVIHASYTEGKSFHEIKPNLIRL
jgi:hypothetical protein